MDYKAEKRELRNSIGEEIAALPEQYIDSSNKGLLLQVTALPEFIDARNIMMYFSVEREPATHELAETALSMGKTVAFPLCRREGIMHAHTVSSLDELRPAVLKIPAPPETAPIIAPEDLDLVIVPALMYDNDGYRLGYGGGYFDRYLSGITAFTVGLARARLIKTRMPREPHDVAVKCVVTESGVRRFQRE